MTENDNSSIYIECPECGNKRIEYWKNECTCGAKLWRDINYV